MRRLLFALLVLGALPLAAQNPCAARVQLDYRQAASEADDSDAEVDSAVDPVPRSALASWEDASNDVVQILNAVHPLTRNDWQWIKWFDNGHRNDPAARFRYRLELLRQALRK